MHCKDVSVRDVSVELNKSNIDMLMRDWTSYVRAEYIILRNRSDHAVVMIEKSRGKDLFRKVVSYSIVSLPEDTAFVDDPFADVINVPTLARIQYEHPGKTVVIKGMFHHMSFVSNMVPLKLNVIDNIPPSPSKLGVLVKMALASGFIEHPIIIDEKIIDMADMIDRVRTEAVMFPCRVSGIEADIPVFFLDDAPITDSEVTLVGCDTSRRIYESLYRKDVPFINVCPADLIDDTSVRTIVKCCKVKEGHKIEGNIVKVPWGATVPEIVAALNDLFRT